MCSLNDQRDVGIISISVGVEPPPAPPRSHEPWYMCTATLPSVPLFCGRDEYGRPLLWTCSARACSSADTQIVQPHTRVRTLLPRKIRRAEQSEALVVPFRDPSEHPQGCPYRTGTAVSHSFAFASVAKHLLPCPCDDAAQRFN